MGAPVPATVLAKAALKRLAQDRAEPTPENYRRAYELEAGVPPEAAGKAEAPPSASPPSALVANDEAWSDILERVVKQLDRSTKLWTPARKKDSLQRIFSGSRQNPHRLQQRLQQLLSSWENNREEDGGGGPGTDLAGLVASQPAPLDALEPLESTRGEAGLPTLSLDAPTVPSVTDATDVWPAAVDALTRTAQAALPAAEARAQEASLDLQHAVRDVKAAAHAQALEALTTACEQAQHVIEHRNHLMQQVIGLCASLTDGLVDLAEEEAWVQGQTLAMREQIQSGLNARGVRRIQLLLESTRQRQAELREQRHQARQALKDMIHQMLSEIAELGTHTGRFQDHLGRYAQTIGQAESLESLAGVVREMVEESRAVHSLVSQTRERLQSEHAKATELGDKVKALEDEIRRLSEEVSTDPLTQVANRRGLMRVFDQEQSRMSRDGGSLAVGLLDIDNFKKLNDTLGHQTGDEALKFLSQLVQRSLRPRDTLARYGGEEFVVLLPDTPVEEAQSVLTRLQRELSAELFMHEDKQTFVTFSAGVTPYRPGETLDAALDRADEALYQAKRTGKNRTCMA